MHGASRRCTACAMTPAYPPDRSRSWCANMRFAALAFVLLLQAQPLPPPYPVHRHLYDYTGVYYSNGDRVIVSEQGIRSRTSSVAWDTFFYRRGVTHSEEGASDEPLLS